MVSVLAVLEQPALCLRLKASDGTDVGAGAQALLQHLAKRSETSSLQLLLGPDLQRSEHPPADLEASQRTLLDLKGESTTLAPIRSGGSEADPWTLVHWS